MKKFLINILVAIMFLPILVNAEDKEITLHLFHGATCPHCKEEIEYLNTFLEDNKNIKLEMYEVWNDSDNKTLFKEVQDLLDVSANGVPYLVIGSKVIMGFSSDTTPASIEKVIKYYNENDYIDYVANYINTGIKEEIKEEVEEVDKNIVSVPVLGEVDAKKVSLPLVSIIIGFVDGFNPCALWILIFLITMLFNMKNRKKMWILGSLFLITSSLVYILFMVSWLKLAMFLNQITIIKIFISLFAVIFGIVNIAKFFKTSETGCDVVNSNKRKNIMNKIKDIVNEKRFIISIIGIIMLAISVNIIELMCSLGLPLLFTSILSMNDLTKLEYFIYIMIYMIFFMIDDFVIFFVAMKSSKITAISNKYTKYSHLIGGIIMLIIGVLLVLKPEWLMFNF